MQEMVFVPAGEFLMGDLADERGEDPRARLRVRHTATTGAYWIDKYEVTNAMFKEFLDATKYKPKQQGLFLNHWSDGDYPEGTENQPVRYVSFEDAVAFASWAGKRLPTPEEWEKAARGIDGWTYPWGNQRDRSRHVYIGLDVDLPVAADSFANGASPYGVLHMEGNVAEWTTGKVATTKSWAHDMIVRESVSSAMAVSLFPPCAHWPSLGFRCVKDAAAGDSAPTQEGR